MFLEIVQIFFIVDLINQSLSVKEFGLWVYVYGGVAVVEVAYAKIPQNLPKAIKFVFI